VSYEWDPKKAKTNEEKHGISFEEAIGVFEDPRLLTRYDEDHSTFGEDRWQVIGQSQARRILFVVYVEREGDALRLISARRATVREKALYRG
jgi:uncharacterized DUF497 family protein